MSRKSVLSIFALLIIASMLLAACGTPAEVTEEPVAPAPTEEAQPTEAPVEPAAPSVFIYGRGTDSVGLDPAIVTDGESFRVSGQILEGLYTFKPGTTEPVGALAEECVANENATEWTCTLRQGVKFHDGTDFNADAVIFNFERWRFTTNPYHYAEQVFEYYEAMWGGFDDASVITSVEKVDDYTVKFVLSTPMAPFLANLAMDMFAISSPAAVEANGAAYGTPAVGAVGTGPFTFGEWVEADHITVDANADYWGGKPTVDQVIWRVIPDASARYLALKAGDIHGMEQATPEDFEAAQGDPELQVLFDAPLNTVYLAFNYKIKELQDPKVREAIAHAINKPALAQAFWGASGQVAKTLIPSSMWGFNDAIEDFAYDPELSKQLLTEAGYPDGLSTMTIAEDVLDANGSVVYKAGDVLPLRFNYIPADRFYISGPKAVAEAMAADLAKAGIVTELYTPGDWATYLGERRNGTLVGLYMLGWGGDNGDPDNFTGYFFSGAAEPIAREGWYQNAELAELLQRAVTLPSQEEREPLYKQADQILHDEAARVWLVHQATPILLSAKVSGYQPQAVDADNYDKVVINP
jgi:peptide/nickel transport system substrate-binding protein